MIKYFILTFPVENLEQLIATKCFISIKNWLKNVFIVCLQGIFKSMLNQNWGRRGCDRMLVGLTTTCAISASHH